METRSENTRRNLKLMQMLPFKTRSAYEITRAESSILVPFAINVRYEWRDPPLVSLWRVYKAKCSGLELLSDRERVSHRVLPTQL